MGQNPIFDEPSQVQAGNGEVSIDGPDSVDVKLTPEAATETAERLLQAAAVAAGNRPSDQRIDRSRKLISRSLDTLRKTRPDTR